MNRANAIAAGVPRYTGAVCERHADVAGQRYVCNYRCVGCALEATVRNGKTETGKRTRKAYLQTDAGSAMMRRARKRNPRKPARFATLREYRAEYRKKPAVAAAKRFYKAVRESNISKNATPSWADKKAIADIYAESKRMTSETGVPHVVDHFYPLAGKSVCGLHVEHNLRVVTEAENLRKNNRMPG